MKLNSKTCFARFCPKRLTRCLTVALPWSGGASLSKMIDWVCFTPPGRRALVKNQADHRDTMYHSLDGFTRSELALLGTETKPENGLVPSAGPL
jgi:hypothetical protein